MNSSSPPSPLFKTSKLVARTAPRFYGRTRQGYLEGHLGGNHLEAHLALEQPCASIPGLTNLVSGQAIRWSKWEPIEYQPGLRCVGPPDKLETWIKTGDHHG